MLNLYKLRPGYIKDKIADYRISHLKLGKLISTERDDLTHDYRVKGTANDVHWQTDIALAVIIRDYLREHIKNSPAIGNCVIEDEYRNDMRKQMEITKEQWNGYAEKWKNAVNKTADEFDELIKMTERGVYSDNYPSEEELKAATEKAFKDLAFIYNDLSW